MNLKKLRDDLGLNPIRAAKKAKISLPTWTALETEATDMPKSLKQIAKAFGVVVEIHPNGSIDYRKP